MIWLGRAREEEPSSLPISAPLHLFPDSIGRSARDNPFHSVPLVTQARLRVVPNGTPPRRSLSSPNYDTRCSRVYTCVRIGSSAHRLHDLVKTTNNTAELKSIRTSVQCMKLSWSSYLRVRSCQNYTACMCFLIQAEPIIDSISLFETCE